MQGGTNSALTYRWKDPHASNERGPDDAKAVPDRARGAGVPEPIVEDSNSNRSKRRDDCRGIEPGSFVGRYVVQRQLGRGGMGVVYGAVDPELGRRVAIKLVRRVEMSQPFRFTDRLRREAQALARISHPNIVGLYDVGSSTDTRFIALEYLEGRNVRDWLHDTPRTVREIVTTLCAAGQGLCAAHAAGIIHRDFKPTNVMVCYDGQIKVLDFGLARGTPSTDPWMEATTEDLLSTRLTQADIVVGTTGYMAPEQLLGREVGSWSDQFAFCVTLYEALYGERPFPGGNPVEMATTFHKGVPPVVPKRRGVPRYVRKAVLRGLSLDPRDRYPSMQALLVALMRPRLLERRLLMTVVSLLWTAFLSALLTLWLTERLL